MTSRPSIIDRRLRHRFPSLALLLAVTSLLGACASAPAPSGRRDRFPLDPREELAGPFSEGVERGWRALLAEDWKRAERAFRAAGGETLQTAAEIGRIEALVLGGRLEAALAACADLLPVGEPTSPLLVACGEARARAPAGDPLEGYQLYRRALARTTDRPGLKLRAEELRVAASDWLLEGARAGLEERAWKKARAQILRAIDLAPERAALRDAAGDIENSAGDSEKALRRYREALEIEPKNPEVQKKVGELALELNDLALAVSAYDELARGDAHFRPRAEEARMAFRVANWPAPEREAAEAPRLSRAGAASLVWWMFPEVREALVSAGIIASDAVSRRDSRAIARALALGLLEADRETHRANPDAPLNLAAASRLLLRLLAIVKPGEPDSSCLAHLPRSPRSNTEYIQVAQACGLLAESESSTTVSGRAFTRALDRVRALASSGAENSK